MSGLKDLIPPILARSVSQIWEEAKEEWFLVYIEDSGYVSSNCLCGEDIRELCHIKNRLNNRETVVGNVCIRHFLGINTSKMFRSIDRIRADRTRSISDDMLSYAYRRGMISDWEVRFYYDISKKRSLSERQELKKIEVNNKILSRLHDKSYRDPIKDDLKKDDRVAYDYDDYDEDGSKIIHRKPKRHNYFE